MNRYLITAAAMVFTLLVGCSNARRLPDEAFSPRASLDIEKTKISMKPIEQEETSQEIRNVVLQAIRDDMIAVGKHPVTAIESSELVSLVVVPPSNATGSSRVNYRALVRLNFQRHWLQVEYLVMERDGNIIVRKTSL